MFGTPLASCSGMVALFIGVPPFATMMNTLSRLISLFAACTARGTWYCMSSTTYLILRPLMPPSALASSNTMRQALVLLTPHIAVTPDRSV